MLLIALALPFVYVLTLLGVRRAYLRADDATSRGRILAHTWLLIYEPLHSLERGYVHAAGIIREIGRKLPKRKR